MKKITISVKDAEGIVLRRRTVDKSQVDVMLAMFMKIMKPSETLKVEID